MIKLNCPRCEHELTFADDLRGGAAACYYCGVVLTLPDDLEVHVGEPDDPVEPLIPERAVDASALTTVIKIASQTMTLGGTLSSSQERGRGHLGLWFFLGTGVLALSILGAAVLLSMRSDPAPSTAGATAPSLGELSAALPEADHAFLLRQYDARRSVEEARRAWRQHLIDQAESVGPVEIDLARFEKNSERVWAQHNPYQRHVVMASNGIITFEFTAPQAGRYEAVIHASGTPAMDAWPTFSLRVGMGPTHTFTLSGPERETFTQPFELTAGRHRLHVQFLNDWNNRASGGTEDRNLLIHSITLKLRPPTFAP